MTLLFFFGEPTSYADQVQVSFQLFFHVSSRYLNYEDESLNVPSSTSHINFLVFSYVRQGFICLVHNRLIMRVVAALDDLKNGFFI